MKFSRTRNVYLEFPIKYYVHYGRENATNNVD